MRVIRSVFLQHVFQCLPQEVGQHADEDVGFDAVAELMPDRAQEFLALERAEGVFGTGELDVGRPELLASPTGLVAEQQIGPVACHGRLEFGLGPGPGDGAGVALRRGG